MLGIDQTSNTQTVSLILSSRVSVVLWKTPNLLLWHSTKIALWWRAFPITAMSHELHGVSKDQQFEGSLKNCEDWHEWQHKNCALLTSLSQRNPSGSSRFPAQRTCNVEGLSMPCRLCWQLPNYVDRNSIEQGEWILYLMSIEIFRFHNAQL